MELLQTVARALEVVGVLADEGELSLADISERLDLSKPGVHRALATLRELGWAEQVEHTRKYRLSLRIWEMGMRALEHLPVYASARPLLERLARDAGTTVNLSIYDRGAMLYLAFVIVEDDRTVWVPAALRAAPHATAGGKVALAFAAEFADGAEVGELAAMTPYTVTDAEALRRELGEARQRGYAVNERGHTDDVSAVAAPIFDQSGRYFASVSISTTTSFSDAWVAHVAPMAIECAAHISLALGFRPRANLGRAIG